MTNTLLAHTKSPETSSTNAASTNKLTSSIRAEIKSAMATPAAKLLLAMSVVMATASTVANLSAVDDLTTDDALQLAMHASTIPTLMFSILAGLYSATTDFRFGLMDQRLLSNPNRTQVLGAKATVAGATGLLYGAIGALTAIAIGVAYFQFSGETFDAGSPLVVRALIGVIVGAPLFAVLGVALGTIIRNQPIAIGGTLAWLLIIEPVVIVGAPKVGRWFPGGAGVALTNAPDPGLLDQVPAGLTLATVTGLLLLIAAWRFRSADL